MREKDGDEVPHTLHQQGGAASQQKIQRPVGLGPLLVKRPPNYSNAST